MDSRRLLFIFRLVTAGNGRGRVWEGGNGKKGYPQKGVPMPRWKAFIVLSPDPCSAPVSGTSPTP